jgi:hypothetical protein
MPKTSDLLKRFEIAKGMANLWDGERDGLREAVKVIPAGQYEDVLLTWSTSAEVVYVNSDGKYQLEFCLQTSIPGWNPPTPEEDCSDVIALRGTTPELLLDLVLHHMQTSKANALEYLKSIHIGSGELVSNELLYEKKGSNKSKIQVLPPGCVVETTKA